MSTKGSVVGKTPLQAMMSAQVADSKGKGKEKAEDVRMSNTPEDDDDSDDSDDDTPTTSTGTERKKEKKEKAKVSKPDLFDGGREKLDDWLLQFDLYFRFTNGIKPKDQVPLAASYTRGRAQKWIKPYLRAYFTDREDDEDATKWIESWSLFKKQIQMVFGYSNEKQTAIRTIQHIRQKTSAAEYATEFTRHSALTEWDDDSLMVMYKRGLKDGVKDELMRTSAYINTLSALITMSIDIDDKLYERAMERKYDGGQKGTPRENSQPHRAEHGYFSKQQRNHWKHPDPYGHTPIELDVLKIKGQGNEEQGNRDYKKKTGFSCYACGKPGHMAKDCRSGKMVQRRQINMLSSVKKTPKERRTERQAQEALALRRLLREEKKSHYKQVVVEDSEEEKEEPNEETTHEVNQLLTRQHLHSVEEPVYCVSDELKERIIARNTVKSDDEESEKLEGCLEENWKMENYKQKFLQPEEEEDDTSLENDECMFYLEDKLHHGLLLPETDEPVTLTYGLLVSKN